MTIEFPIANRPKAANAFQIFEEIGQLPQSTAEALCSEIKRMEYQAFLASAYWFAVSTVVKSRAGNRCQLCNNPQGIQAHHRSYQHHGREHLHMEDLTVLCDACHTLHHFPNSPTVPSKAEPIQKIPLPPPRSKKKKKHGCRTSNPPVRLEAEPDPSAQGRIGSLGGRSPGLPERRRAPRPRGRCLGNQVGS